MIKKEKFISPALMWIIVIIGIIISLKFIPDTPLFKGNFFTIAIFLMTIVYWVYFFMNAFLVHKKAIYSVDKIDKLVKSGVYSFVRHPFYSADIILAIGIFLFIPRLDALIAVIWSIIIFVFWMNLEEKALIKKFGNEYIEYKKEVPMFIPIKCK